MITRTDYFAILIKNFYFNLIIIEFSMIECYVSFSSVQFPKYHLDLKRFHLV